MEIDYADFHFFSVYNTSADGVNHLENRNHYCDENIPHRSF